MVFGKLRWILAQEWSLGALALDENMALNRLGRDFRGFSTLGLASSFEGVARVALDF
jgi:hypothetical protein